MRPLRILLKPGSFLSQNNQLSPLYAKESFEVAGVFPKVDRKKKYCSHTQEKYYISMHLVIP